MSIAEIDDFEAREREGIERRYRAAVVGHETRFREFRKIVKDYVASGIAKFSAPEFDTFKTHTGKDQIALVRALATEMGRPFVWAVSHPKGWDGSINYARETIHLSIPKRNRLKGLASPLLILSTDKLYSRRGTIGADPEPVTRDDTGGMWNFYFFGGEGKGLFDAFYEKAHTDPVNRVILNLD